MAGKIYFCVHRWNGDVCSRCGVARGRLPDRAGAGPRQGAIPDSTRRPRSPRDLRNPSLTRTGAVAVQSSFPDFDPWATTTLGPSIIAPFPPAQRAPEGDASPTPDGFPIAGPPQFGVAVRRILADLRERAPQRYREAVGSLPKAVYDPDRLRQETNDGTLARSDGIFAIDGSDYEAFRFVFLHEVGHNVAQRNGGDNSEAAADDYANRVIRELG